MKLIEDWKDAWRWFSIWAGTVGSAMAATYAVMYEQLKETIPPQWMAALTAAVFIAGMVGRIIDQKPRAK